MSRALRKYQLEGASSAVSENFRRDAYGTIGGGLSGEHVHKTMNLPLPDSHGMAHIFNNLSGRRQEIYDQLQAEPD